MGLMKKLYTLGKQLPKPEPKEEIWYCPICSSIMEYIESVFSNELGESEVRGYVCKECGFKEGDL